MIHAARAAMVRSRSVFIIVPFLIFVEYLYKLEFLWEDDLHIQYKIHVLEAFVDAGCLITNLFLYYIITFT